MVTLAVVGRTAPRSQPAAMFVDGVQVQSTRTPIAAQLCPCGRVGCDCDEWHEIAHTSPFEGEQDAAQESAPLFTWSDETIGGTWTATGRLHHDWTQPETDWIRTGC